ncbi:winged helix DNA-binding domain-containing protein [Actinokineospora terrae]|uniref:Winged helix DNA-binding domain-containing protein n=1 Tax=Actinokineospora terrae TaxID=155974 RepID=A0A1H9RUE9_9PSEU|nr:winged helix DNA-binding domain-containing protein [Actinokineospora terrae]SER76561.1 Winged helix DNA-binding domain-containing protein [Actinokineospora terrae]
MSLVARTVANGLAGPRAVTVVDAVRRVVGIQSQDVRPARLAVRVRTEGLTRSDVDRAVADGDVVRTWAMRGTLHMVAAEDAGWLVHLLGPRFAHAARGRRLSLGIDDALAEAGAEIIATDEPHNRAELVARLADNGIALDPKTQAPAHMIAYAAMTGRVRRGPDRSDTEPTYVRFDPGDPVDEPAAVARLAERYLTGYGPATAEDFAAWSGLPLGKARAGLGDRQADPVADPGPTTRLLGHFDAYLLGYKSRDGIVPPELAKRVQAGGGFIMPTVLRDGAVVGTWRLEKNEVITDPGLDVEAEVQDIARWNRD